MARARSTLHKLNKHDEDLVRQWKKIFEPSRKRHDELAPYWRKWHRAYRGAIEDQDRAYNNVLKPKHIYQVIQLLAANIIDDQPKPKVIPVGQKDVEGARSFETLLEQQRRRDYRDEKMPVWVTQALVTNLSPFKIGWEIREGEQKFRRWVPDPANPLGGYQEIEDYRHQVDFDQPTMIVIPVSDFFFDPAGNRPDEWSCASHRTWQTMDELRAEEEAGRYRNIRLVAESRGDEPPKGDDDYLKLDRSNRVEVIETWFFAPEGLRMITMANKTVPIRDETNLFWHGNLPFGAASTIPDLDNPYEFSEVESIIADAEAYARILNQALDNNEYTNNGMLAYNPEAVEDVDALEVGPGAKLPRSMPNDWEWIQSTGSSIIEPSLRMLETVLNNMRDIPGANAYLAGGSSEGIDQDTAAGINLLQNMAQRRMILKKNFIAHPCRRMGQMEIELNKQLMKRPLALPTPAQAGGYEFKTVVLPQDIADCDAHYEVEDAAENLDKQQARVEASEMLTTWVSLVPIMNVPGSPVWAAVEPAARKWLESYDVKDPDAWIVPAPPMPPPLPPPMPPTLPPPSPGFGGEGNGSAPAPGGSTPIGAGPPLNGGASAY